MNTRKTARVLFVSLITALLPSGCATDAQNQDAGADQGAADSATIDAGVEDAAPDSAPVPDAAAPDGAPPSEIENEFGFEIRTPKEHTVPCPDAPEYQDQEISQVEMDWVCTIDHGGVVGHVYIASTPIACESVGMSQAPVFETTTAEISIDGKLTPLTEAQYDWGGNHQNDALGFAHGGKYYRFYHSSFGFGWRKCQPMDCIQVMAAKDGKVIEDGCTSERTIPAVCLPVAGAKSFGADDFVDTFAKCLGDDSP